ncbi:MAG: class I SAM-dependent methyltransferase [Candidatus Poribacteria bacterium]
MQPLNRKFDPTRKRYNRIAAVYDLMEKPVEMLFFRHWRRKLFSQVKGRVLEVGVGTGKNIPYYPKELKVIAVDISEKMLQSGQKRASVAGKTVQFALMDAQHLAFKDEIFDTIVATFVFCSVSDPVEGLKELLRVIKQDGRILLLEHVKSKHRIMGKLMDILNPLTVKMAGFNINRDTVTNVKNAGLSILLENNLKGDVFKELLAVPCEEIS